MYVVTVEFIAHPDNHSSLREALLRQARNSLDLEPDCHTFLVSEDDNDATRFFLYEEYTSRAAFELHLASPHFLEFDALITSWVASKKVDTWQRLSS